MIRNLVCSNLRLHIDKSESSHMVFNTINSMFHFPSRTTHIGLWQEILKSTVELPEDIPPLINKIKSIVEELQRTGFAFTKDSFLSVALQLGFPSSFSGINTVLGARLQGSPDTAILDRETKEAIRAETHRLSSASTDDFPNLSALSIDDHGAQLRFQTLICEMLGTCEVYRPPSHHTPTLTGHMKPFFRITESTPAHLRCCFDCGNKGHWAKNLLCTHSPSYWGDQPTQGLTRGSFRVDVADASQSTPLPHAVYSSEGSLTKDWNRVMVYWTQGRITMLPTR